LVPSIFSVDRERGGTKNCHIIRRSFCWGWTCWTRR